MGRPTDTSIVRDYCNANIGGIFDLNYLASEVFPDIPHVNMRKIATRLADAGLLRQISKGVYFIGESELSDEERIIKHYLFEGDIRVGMFTGKSLLFELGLTKQKPSLIEIKTNKTIGNKTIGNVDIKHTDSNFASGLAACYEIQVAIELIINADYVDGDKTDELYQQISRHIRRYSDVGFKGLSIDYPRIVYIKLADLLNSMEISNRVMEIYVEKSKLLSE